MKGMTRGSDTFIPEGFSNLDRHFSACNWYIVYKSQRDGW